MIEPYYSHGGIEIYCADNREVLPGLGKVDLVLTDPPFSARTHANAKSNRDKGHGNKTIDFSAIESLLVACGSICDGWFVSFMDWRHITELERSTPEPWEFMRFGVWVKTNPMPQISADRPANGWDGIVYLRHGASKPGWNGGGCHGNWIGPLVSDGAHPTGKPLSFILQLVERFSNPGDTICDPFAGSLTTAVAAKQLGRKCICIEREEKYCEIGVKRLQQEYLAL